MQTGDNIRTKDKIRSRNCIGLHRDVAQEVLFVVVRRSTASDLASSLIRKVGLHVLFLLSSLSIWEVSKVAARGGGGLPSIFVFFGLVYQFKIVAFNQYLPSFFAFRITIGII